MPIYTTNFLFYTWAIFSTANPIFPNSYYIVILEKSQLFPQFKNFHRNSRDKENIVGRAGESRKMIHS